MDINKKQFSLMNTLHRLKCDKELSIVYIGGSVTDGYGSSNPTEYSWAQLIGKKMRERYPDAQIKNLRLSIGGTGSYFSVFRYRHDIAPAKPDLLFVEYAINDMYNGSDYRQVLCNSESIVRTALEVNPYIDIVFVLTFNNEVKDSDYEQLRAHRDVATHYGCPFIKLSSHVYAMLEEKGHDFFEYFKDNVHPNDAGYSFYADTVWSLLLFHLTKAEESGNIEYKEKELPAETISSEILRNARIICADEIDLSESVGWEYQPDNDFSWLGRRYNGRIFAKETGAVLRFEFEGTHIGLATGIGPCMGTISVTVDDIKPVILDEYNQNPNPKDRLIAENLPIGKHTVTVEVTGKNSLSEGSEFEIGAILIN